ncbi:hypothetical protein [Mycolicibacterium pulveris]|uniref:hypothetical protein n=1 Tax=Mycolicibacterium pulveris TaxID=36813 RepID=UPI003CEF28FA
MNLIENEHELHHRHPPAEWTQRRFEAAQRMEPLPHSMLADPDRVTPPTYMFLRAGTPEQCFRSAFTRGALDGLREAYRECCPECRSIITGIAHRYQQAQAAA